MFSLAALNVWSTDFPAVLNNDVRVLCVTEARSLAPFSLAIRFHRGQIYGPCRVILHPIPRIRALLSSGHCLVHSFPSKTMHQGKRRILLTSLQDFTYSIRPFFHFSNSLLPPGVLAPFERASHFGDISCISPFQYSLVFSRLNGRPGQRRSAISCATPERETR
jgi:hypothetical protein